MIISGRYLLTFPTTTKGEHVFLESNKILKYMHGFPGHLGSHFSIIKYKFVLAPRFIYYTFNIYFLHAAICLTRQLWSKLHIVST